MGGSFQDPLCGHPDPQCSSSLNKMANGVVSVHNLLRLLPYALNHRWLPYDAQCDVNVMQIAIALCCLGNNNNKKPAHVQHRCNYFLSDIFNPELDEPTDAKPVGMGATVLPKCPALIVPREQDAYKFTSRDGVGFCMLFLQRGLDRKVLAASLGLGWNRVKTKGRGGG